MMNAASGRVFSWRLFFSGGVCFLCGGSLVATVLFAATGCSAWRLFGRVLRTLGGRNIGKCRLRAHQHPLLPPLSNQRSHELPPTYLQSDSSNERVLGMTCAVFPDSTLFRASILDFRPRLANRCRDFPVYPLFRALILNFKPRLANRCRVLPVYALLRASILDFKARLANRCKVLPVYALQRAVILDLRWSIWESLQVFAWKRPPVCSDS